MSDGQQELEWNIAKERIKKIAQILSKLRDAYEQAKHDRSRKNVRAYYTYLNALYMELRIYIEEEKELLYREKELQKMLDGSEDLQEFQEKLDAGRKTLGERLDELEKVVSRRKGGKIPLQHFKKMEKIDIELNKKRSDLNLDIPRKKGWQEGEELLF